MRMGSAPRNRVEILTAIRGARLSCARHRSVIQTKHAISLVNVVLVRDSKRDARSRQTPIQHDADRDAKEHEEL